MREIHGSGYVPGYAGGHISRASAPSSGLASIIVLLDKPDIDSLLKLSSNPPEGAILVGRTRFSHLAIYLYSLNIPTVFIEDREKGLLNDGEFVLLDGLTGLLLIAPSEEARLSWLGNQTNNTTNPLIEGDLHTATSQDGISVNIGASISNVAGASYARLQGADEVGLLRSEFLFTSISDPKNLETHLAALESVCEAATPLSVNVRLLDVGGEKIFNWVPKIEDLNKTLGIRGARTYSHKQFKPLFECQLEAILRLSTRYKLSILIPFVSSPEEFFLVHERIKNIIGSSDLKIGAMIETPSMCFCLPEIAGTADYVAVGTNDLMQCFFAADRGLKSTAKYLEPYSPALFRLLNIVFNDSIEHNIPVQVCGQLSLYPFIAALLVSMGYRHFSVEPSVVPALKKVVRGINIARMKEDVLSILNDKGTDNFKLALANLQWSYD